MEHFEEVYDFYSEMVYNIALNYVQHQQDAEEITQDVFIKVYKKKSLFEERSSLKTWIYRITINTSLDFLRSKKRRPILTALFSSQDNQPEKNEWRHAGILLEEKEGYDALFNALNQLPEKQKTAIILLKVEGLSQKEASLVLNISVKGLESLFQRAKNNLRLLLKEGNK